MTTPWNSSSRISGRASAIAQPEGALLGSAWLMAVPSSGARAARSRK
ncbi:hypothetical protein [Xanthobacter pseudotagetidis]